MRRKMFAIIMSFLVFCGTCLGKDIFGREVRVEKAQYSVEDGCSFELEGINGDMEISTWNNDEIYVELTKIAKKEKDLDKIRAVVVKEEGKFRIYTEIDKGASNVSIDYVIKVPKTLKSMDVYSKNGDIEVSKVKVPVKLSSINGSIDAHKMGTIEIAEIKSGDINISDADLVKSAEVLNGNIEIKNVENVDAVSVQSGNIDIEDVVVIKKAECKNGNIEIEMNRVTGQMELVNINGNIEIKILEDLGGTIEFSTVNGDVDIDDFDVEYIKKSWNGVEGRIGSGANKIIATNINGSIELERK